MCRHVYTPLYTCLAHLSSHSSCTLLCTVLYTCLHKCPYTCPYPCLYPCPYPCLYTCLYTDAASPLEHSYQPEVYPWFAPRPVPGMSTHIAYTCLSSFLYISVHMSEQMSHMSIVTWLSSHQLASPSLRSANSSYRSHH